MQLGLYTCIDKYASLLFLRTQGANQHKMTQTIWAESALLAQGWATSVEILIDTNGDVIGIASNQPFQKGDRVEILMPAIANVHSHAHQRAMAGLGECAGTSGDSHQDSFWTWRKVMYQYLQRIEPDDLQAIAAQLYLEMLKAGYSCVGEFQYLHHQNNGTAYQNRAEMTLRCLQAARDVGIGFTALPVLYRYGDFGATPAVEGQQRFLNNANEFCEIVALLQKACAGDLNCSVGIAPHSLRAIDKSLLNEVLEFFDKTGPIHLHIAEQSKEIEGCLAWSGQRPVEWLFDQFEVDQQWCLIHATHMTVAETQQMAASGCIAGLCPTTEANLGDGYFNALEYFADKGYWAIGSDSHVSIDPVEELRWLEYGMRLQNNGRNMLASPKTRNTGRNLIDGALQGGAKALGRKIGSIDIGYRADFIVLDLQHPRLYQRREDELLDSWIFSGNQNLIRDVYVAGKKVIDQGHHANETLIANNYRAAIDRLAR